MIMELIGMEIVNVLFFDEGIVVVEVMIMFYNFCLCQEIKDNCNKFFIVDFCFLQIIEIVCGYVCNFGIELISGDVIFF